MHMTAILTPAEIGWIRGWPGDRHVEWATLIFCAKECFFKLQHPLTGQWVDFLEAEVSLVPGQSEFSLACTKSAATDLLGRARFPGRYAGGYGLTLAAMHLPAVGA